MKRNVIPFVLLGLITLAVFSCKKDDETKPENNYSVSKFTQEYYDSFHSYKYNENNKLIEVKDYYKGSDQPYQIRKFVYNEENKIKDFFHTNYKDSIILKGEITYNGEKIKTQKYMSERGDLLFEYNEKEQMVKVSMGNQYNTFEYDEKGNVTLESSYMKDTIAETIMYEYDNKVNPLYSNVIYLDFFFRQLSFNNITKKTSFNYFLGKPEKNRSMEYIYEYNSDGLPVKVFSKDDEEGEKLLHLFSFDYEKKK